MNNIKQRFISTTLTDHLVVLGDMITSVEVV